MKKFIITFCCLSLISFATYTFSSTYAQEKCFPITYYETFKDAVSQFKELTASSSPILKPSWLPFDVVSQSTRIVGCGTILKTEYTGAHEKLRIHVAPHQNNLKSINKHHVTLRDGTLSEFMENKYFFVLRFNRSGRLYLIVMDKNKKIRKDSAITTLKKVSDSLEVIRN